MLRRIIFAMALTVLLAAGAFGQQAGQIVGVITDSKGEAIPGAFEFARNAVFNARNFFASQRDPLKRNQFGAFGGGPVVLPHDDLRSIQF